MSLGRHTLMRCLNIWVRACVADEATRQEQVRKELAMQALQLKER